MATGITRRVCVTVMSLSLLSLAVPPPAAAAIVATDQAVSLAQRGVYLDRVHATLARKDVREQLLAMGVDPGEVAARVNSLTDSELASLSQRMDQAPAGGDVLAVVGIVFIVLLILDYVGVIHIFRKA